MTRYVSSMGLGLSWSRAFGLGTALGLAFLQILVADGVHSMLYLRLAPVAALVRDRAGRDVPALAIAGAF